MKRITTLSTTLTAAGALLAAPVAVLALASPASADTERRGSCGSGTYEFQVEREDGGFELNADLDRVAPGSRWTLTFKHDGTRVSKVTRTADADGEVDLEAGRADSAGSDRFVFKAKPAAGGSGCRSVITVR